MDPPYKLSVAVQIVSNQSNVSIGFALLGAFSMLFFVHPLLEVVHWLQMGMPSGFSVYSLIIQPILTAFAPERWPMSLALSAIGAVLGTGFETLHLRLSAKSGPHGPQNPVIQSTRDLEEMISLGEDAGLEFKSSLRWDRKLGKVNKDLEFVVAKTLCGMMNHNGGILLIGVTDQGTVVGIEDDFPTLKQKNWDGFQQRIMTLAATALGGLFADLIQMAPHQVNEKTVAVLQVVPASSPVFLHDGKTNHYFLRSGNEGVGRQTGGRREPRLQYAEGDDDGLLPRGRGGRNPNHETLRHQPALNESKKPRLDYRAWN